MTSELEPRRSAGAITGADVLEGNAMGIAYGDGTAEEKLGRLVALVPMALEVVDEARDTIARLRDENERLRAENAELKSALDRSRA
jgi:PII-like signaling protein